MARAIIVKITCDVCGDDTEDAQTTLKLDRKEVLLDLCGEHKTELTEQLSIFLEKGARQKRTAAAATATAERPAPTGEREACRICMRTFIDREGIRKHLSRAHGMTLTAYDKGEQPPSKEPASVPPVTKERPHECPECHGGYSNPQGLAAHRRQVHGVAGKSAKVA